MDKGIYVDKDKQRLLIQGDRQLLIVYPKELINLIVKDEDLFTKASKRGKSEVRTQKNEYRTNRQNEYYAEKIAREEAELLKDIMSRD